MTDDYLELDLHLEDYEEFVHTVYVHMLDGTMIQFDNVVGNPVRYKGWWSIDQKFYNMKKCNYIESSRVEYLSVTIREPNA